MTESNAAPQEHSDECSQRVAQSPVLKMEPAHFWVCTYPYFQSTLVLVPVSPENLPQSVSLHLYDPDGATLNEITLSCGELSPMMFEIDPFLEAAKLESGLKHAHLKIESDAPIKTFVRYHTAESACVVGPCVTAVDGLSRFFPLTVSENRENVFVVLNSSPEKVSVRCRLYRGNRKPEHILSIPAFGVRLVSIESVFREYFDPGEKLIQQCYVRIGTRAHEPLAVQLLERNILEGDKSLFSLVG